MIKCDDDGRCATGPRVWWQMVLGLALIAFCVPMLASCSSSRQGPPVATAVARLSDGEVRQLSHAPAERPQQAAWLGAGRRLYVSLGGSRSCPPSIDTVSTGSEPNSLVLTYSHGSSCTDDTRSFVIAMRLGPQINVDEPVLVHVPSQRLTLTAQPHSIEVVPTSS